MKILFNFNILTVRNSMIFPQGHNLVKLKWYYYLFYYTYY